MSAAGKWMPAASPVEDATPEWVSGGVADAPAAAVLATRAFDPHFREAWSAVEIAGLLATADSWLELGRAGSVPIAFALCRHVHEEVELLLCAIEPDWRRRGLGRRLVARVAEQARQRGASRLFLEVRSSNAPAIALYHACGFVPIGTRPDYYRTLAGERIDAITLALTL